MQPAELTPAAGVFLGVAGIMAVTNWWAVTAGKRVVEWVTKPATMVFLIAAAVALHPAHQSMRIWIVIGLLFSLAGDVLLMLPEEQFVGGLVAFLLGHIAYVVALFGQATSWPLAIVGMVIVLVAVGTVGRIIVGSVRHGNHPEFTGPVIAYLTVISLMAIAAFASANPWAIAGALFFYSSDGILAWNKFVQPFRIARPAIMSTYHLAQFGLVLSLL